MLEVVKTSSEVQLMETVQGRPGQCLGQVKTSSEVQLMETGVARVIGKARSGSQNFFGSSINGNFQSAIRFYILLASQNFFGSSINGNLVT